MESIIQAGESSLISALNYSHSDRMANYVQKRESTQFFAPGTMYSPSTAKVIRIDINGAGFLMPDSIVLRATVRNNEGVATNRLVPLTPDLACMISEIKVTMGGTEVERITSYNRIHEMLMRGTSTAKRSNLAAMGFGKNTEVADIAAGYGGSGAPIVGGTALKVLGRPLCGICNTHQYIPLWLLSTGVQFEITLVDSPEAAVVTIGAGTAKNSEKWQWEQVSVMCDIISVSSELMESFAQHTLNGRSLSMSALRSYTTIVYTNSSEQALLTIPRALTRLNAVFVSFVDTAAGVLTGIKKLGNTFHAPGAPQDGSAPNEKFSSFVQIGATRYPQGQNEGNREHWWRYLAGLGIATSGNFTVDNNIADYGKDSFIQLTDLERAGGVATHSGESTYGATLTIDLRNMKPGATAAPGLIYVTLFHDLIVDMSDAGVTVAM
jgi:hypothetical protein